CDRSRVQFLGIGGGGGEAGADWYSQPSAPPSFSERAVYPVWPGCHWAPPWETYMAQKGLSLGKHSLNCAGSLSTWQTALPTPLKSCVWYSRPLFFIRSSPPLLSPLKPTHLWSG